MNKPFVIEFDYPLDGIPLKVKLRAIAEPRLNSSVYMIHSFSYTKDSAPDLPLLPAQDIQCITEAGKSFWINLESQRETPLSSAIGSAIEKVIY